MSGFKVLQNSNGPELELALSGIIDEDVQFPSFDLSSTKQIVFDLKDVKSINSVGIREWLNWIKALSEKCQIVMKNCPKSLVFQFNMVDGFLPKGSKVTSLYVPFFCEKCDLEENILFQVGEQIIVKDGNVSVKFELEKIKPCQTAVPECGLTIDITEDKYFQFLKRSND